MLGCKKHPKKPLPDRCLTCAIAARENDQKILDALKCAVEWLDNAYSRYGLELADTMPNNSPSRSTMHEIIEYAEKLRN